MHSVSVSNKLVVCYLHLLKFVSVSVLPEYGLKRAPVKTVGTTRADPQNSTLASLGYCANEEVKTCTCLQWFVWSVLDILSEFL